MGLGGRAAPGRGRERAVLGHLGEDVHRAGLAELEAERAHGRRLLGLDERLVQPPRRLAREHLGEHVHGRVVVAGGQLAALLQRQLVRLLFRQAQFLAVDVAEYRGGCAETLPRFSQPRDEFALLRPARHDRHRGGIADELATAVHPFLRGSLVDTLYAVTRDEPRPLPEVRPDLPRTLQDEGWLDCRLDGVQVERSDFALIHSAFTWRPSLTGAFAASNRGIGMI